jgi:mRNA-degrading endonuclease toxin of MazEF toxin-antitoxin module
MRRLPGRWGNRVTTGAPMWYRMWLIRGIPTEVVLTKDDGLPSACAANFDNLQTVPESNIGDRIIRLTTLRMKEAAVAVSFALGFDTQS